MMSIPGVEFEVAWKNRKVVELNGFDIPFISRSDLIPAKKARGRPQDTIDVEKLIEAENWIHLTGNSAVLRYAFW